MKRHTYIPIIEAIELKVEHERERGMYVLYSYAQPLFGSHPAKNFVGERETAEDAQALMRRVKASMGIK